MRNYFILFIIFLPILGISQTTNKLQSGLEAYENGKFTVAYGDLLPHASEGDKIAQYHIGLLFLNGQGVEKSDEKAKSWLKRAAGQDYDLAMEQLGLLSMEESNYGAALFWFDRIVGYQSIILYEFPSPMQEKAEKRIREIYKKVDLFPPPDSGWLAGEIEIHRERMTPNRAVTIYLVIIARSYFMESSGQEVQLRIVLNDFNTAKIIDALNGTEGEDMETIREELRSKNVSEYSYRNFKGYIFHDPNGGLHERVIIMRSKPRWNSMVKVFSNQNNGWSEHYLNQMELERINRTIGGHGIYFME